MAISQILLSHLKNILEFVPLFLRNPRQRIRELPDWDWPTILIVQSTLALFAGAICGVFSESVMGLIGNIILAPIQLLLLNLILSAIFYAFARWKFGVDLDHRELYKIVMISQIPLIILRSLGAFDLPTDLLGLGITAILVKEAIPHHFPIDRQIWSRFIKRLYLLYFLVWLSHFLLYAHHEYVFQKQVSV